VLLGDLEGEMEADEKRVEEEEERRRMMGRAMRKSSSYRG